MLKKLSDADLNKQQPADEFMLVPAVRDAKDEEHEKEFYFELNDDFTDTEIEILFPKHVLRFFKWHEDSQQEEVRKRVKKFTTKMRLHSVNNYTLVKNRKASTYTAAPEFPVFLLAEEKHKVFYMPMHPDPDQRYLRDGGAPKNYIHGIDQVMAEWRQREEDAMDEDDDYEAEEASKKEKKKAKKLDEIIIMRDPADAFGPALMGYWCCWYNKPTDIIDDYDFSTLSRVTEKIYQVIQNTEFEQKIAHEAAIKHLDLFNIEMPAEYKPDPDQEGLPIVSLFDFQTYHKKFDLDKLLENSLPYRFWEKEPEYAGTGAQRTRVGYRYAFDNVQAYNFLNKMGFYRLPVEDRKAEYVFVRVDKNKVYEVKSNNVKNYIHGFVKERQLDKSLRNTLYKSAQLNDTSLSNLEEANIDFNYFDNKTQYMFFENITWEVTAAGITEHKPGDVKRYVWEDDVIPHPVKVVPPAFEIKQLADGSFDIEVKHQDCMFFNYLIQTSRIHWRKELEVEADLLGEEERKQYLIDNKFKIDGRLLSLEERTEQKKHLINKIFALGYLMHRHKDRARAWAVVGMDNNRSPEGKSYGGSGKSICFNQALPEVLRKMHHIPGTNADKTKDPHIFHGLTKFHQATVIDDADQYLNFRFFFEYITGDQVVNPKQNAPFTILFKDVGKLIWLTNFAFVTDPSTARRIIYTAFSDYYHEKTDSDDFREKRQPKDDFGKNLIDDFDEAEYNHFMNTMARCLQFGMACPIKYEPPMDNVNKRNLQREMGTNFESWAAVYFNDLSGNLDKLIVKDEAFQEFVHDQNIKGNYSESKFKTSVKNFCQFHGYIFCPEELINDKTNRRIIHQVPHRKMDKGGTWPDTTEKKAKELIYIQTSLDKPLNRLMPGEERLPF